MSSMHWFDAGHADVPAVHFTADGTVSLCGRELTVFTHPRNFQTIHQECEATCTRCALMFREGRHTYTKEQWAIFYNLYRAMASRSHSVREAAKGQMVQLMLDVGRTATENMSRRAAAVDLAKQKGRRNGR